LVDIESELGKSGKVPDQLQRYKFVTADQIHEQRQLRHFGSKRYLPLLTEQHSCEILVNSELK